MWAQPGESVAKSAALGPIVNPPVTWAAPATKQTPVTIIELYEPGGIGVMLFGSPPEQVYP
jgi:hypothetical protein